MFSDSVQNNVFRISNWTRYAVTIGSARASAWRWWLSARSSRSPPGWWNCSTTRRRGGAARPARRGCAAGEGLGLRTVPIYKYSSDSVP